LKEQTEVEEDKEEERNKEENIERWDKLKNY
jgi:hypothetical protein